MANGIIVVDKPEGWTSMDVCAKLRGLFREKRIGHAGTLDPMATGVLPVFVGRATRAVEFAAEGEKEYVAGLKLGLVTSTQDITGEILETHPVSVTPEQLEEALVPFRGEIQQIPPMYSAIKINGKKLYELARKGREVERPARTITIFSLVLEGQPAPDEFLLRVRCSKGTYVRTLCHDLGQALGCGGCMSSLRRTQAAGFSLDEALPLGDILRSDAPETLLKGVESYFAAYPAVTVSPDLEKKIRNGMTVLVPDLTEGKYRVKSQDGTFLAFSHWEKGKLMTIKSFFEV
jgi:tRNA pseudouridine55 synthase